MPKSKSSSKYCTKQRCRTGCDGDLGTGHFTGLAISQGSACSALTGRPSHVLTALGLSDAAAKASLRLGYGRFTTAAEMDSAADQINLVVSGLLQAAA